MRRSTIFTLVLLLVVACLGLVALGVWRYDALRAAYQEVRFMPPQVLIQAPAAGQTALSGSFLDVESVVIDPLPIQRIEFWVDGEMIDAQEGPSGEITDPQHYHFTLNVLEGVQILSVRAQNSAGIFGQSIPLVIAGTPKSEDQLIYTVVPFGAEDSLEELAAAQQTDVDAIDALNPPVVKDGVLGGDKLIVPAQPDVEEKKEAPQKSAGQQPPAAVTIPPEVQMLSPQPKAMEVISPAILPVLPAGPLPGIPASFKADVKDCKIRLTWSDPTSLALGYRVRILSTKGLSFVVADLMPPQIKSSVLWYQFKAPATGNLSVWLESYNASGSQSTPSKKVFVDHACVPASADDLIVQMAELTSNTAADRIYFYLSIEGQPEMRIPQAQSAFLNPIQGKIGLASPQQSMQIPRPADGSLNLTGECWGWSGMTLNKLSSFADSFSAVAWEGKSNILGNDQCRISFTIQPAKMVPIAQPYAGTADIPPPYDVVEHPLTDEQARSMVNFYRKLLGIGYGEQETLAMSAWYKKYYRRLTWKWDGDPVAISGFNFLLNGLPNNNTLLIAEREAYLPISVTCGQFYNVWNVAANGKNGTVAFSETVHGTKFPACTLFAQVTFSELDMPWSCDGVCIFSNCSTLDVYFTLSVNEVSRSFYGGNFFRPLACGKHDFKNLVQKTSGNVFVVPIKNKNFILDVRTAFMDDDSWSADDDFGNHHLKLLIPVGDIEKTNNQCFDMGYARTDTAETYVRFCLEFLTEK